MTAARSPRLIEGLYPREQLQSLRDAGLVSTEQYEERRARITEEL